MSIKVKLKLNPVSQIIKAKGLDENGDVQKFLTSTVNDRIGRYMPASSATAVLATKKKFIASPTQIVIQGPYAQYQYYGKVMVNAKTGKGPMNIPGVGLRYKKGTILKETERPLDYDTTFHKDAGPFWDRALMAAEGKAIEADVQSYIDRKAGKKT